MKQLFQDLRKGEIFSEDIPEPSCPPGHLLISTLATAISPGTERMLVEFGRAGLIGKARSQPERVRQALDKIRTDGLLPTLEAVYTKLNEPMPLGYCNVGTVLAAKDGASGARFPVGTRVVGNGPHAEVVATPVHLCARVPEEVDTAVASSTPLGAIALQGIRLLSPTLGESFLVMGMGIVGQLTALALRANGCRVIVSDLQKERLEPAREAGFECIDASDADVVAAAQFFSGADGVDGVIIAASTDSIEPIRQAARMCRHRGRIVLVGVVGTEFDRTEFFRKELSFQVSASYGPGRYDEDYESGKYDLPPGQVRWTAERNFQAWLELLRNPTIHGHVEALISRSAFGNFTEAYRQAFEDAGCLLPVLEYPVCESGGDRSRSEIRLRKSQDRGSGVGVIGTGAFARRFVLPSLKKLGVSIEAVSSARGASAARVGRLYNAATASSDSESILSNGKIGTVFVLTRHDSHAALVARALESGKNVFVEKPLAMTLEQLVTLRGALDQSASVLRVGFNRRHAPLVKRASEALATGAGPVRCTITVNAGAVDSRHWTQRGDSGGGRIVGELCHFVDLCSAFAGSPLASVSAVAARDAAGAVDVNTLNVCLRYEDGSIGAIQYWSGGPPSLPKERIVAMRGAVAVELDNFRSLVVYTGKGTKRVRSARQNKGHRECLGEFVGACRTGGDAGFAQLAIETTLATFAISEAITNTGSECMADWWQKLG